MQVSLALTFFFLFFFSGFWGKGIKQQLFCVLKTVLLQF